MNEVRFDEEKLRKRLNKEGFALEHRTKAVIQTGLDFASLQLSSRPKQLLLNVEQKAGGEREVAEIDVYAATSHLELLIECKKTNAKWIFAVDSSQNNSSNVLYECGGYKTKRELIDFTKINLNSSSEGFALNENPDKCGDIMGATPFCHNTFQIVRHLALFLRTSLHRVHGKILAPIIVTNAELHTIQVDDSLINTSGDLTEIKDHKPVNYVAYRVPKQLRWDTSDQVVKNMDGAYHESHLTLYVVNIEHLADFINRMDRWSAALHSTLMIKER